MSATRPPRNEALPGRLPGHEAESESDRIASSNEGSVQPSPRLDWPTFEGRVSGASSGNAYASEEDCNDDEDDENATAIGISLADTTSYRPPPNAFSRPPAATRHMSLQQYSSSSRSHRPRSQRRAHSSSSQHSPYNVISPSHHIDHEAALRASLSTLLSCAAAARSLPRPNRRDTQPETITEAISEDGPNQDAPQNVLQQPAVEFKVTTLDDEIATLDKGKRKAPQSAPSQGTAQAWSPKDRRSAKKPRRSVVGTRTMEDITPTLLTWVVGAGMLVLVGAISFSAGYVAGREAGHAEAAGVGVVKRNLASNRGSGLGLRRSIGAAAGICV
jgi:hypothetical protein